MREEPESTAEFRLYATLAALPVFWGAFLFALVSLMNEELLAQIRLDTGLAVGTVVPLLVVSGLMLEQAFAARKGRDEDGR